MKLKEEKEDLEVRVNKYNNKIELNNNYNIKIIIIMSSQRNQRSNQMRNQSSRGNAASR